MKRWGMQKVRLTGLGLFPRPVNRAGQCFIEYRDYPCGCDGLYASHTLGNPSKPIDTWYDRLCECMDCGAVWWYSDWNGEEDPQYGLA